MDNQSGNDRSELTERYERLQREHFRLRGAYITLYVQYLDLDDAYKAMDGWKEEH